MGGHGNVPEVHTALLSALVNGATLTQARESSPWFFPSETWMRKVLEDLGFHIEILEIEYRPTKLTRGVSGGLEGWVRLMGAQMLDILDEGRRDSAVRETCQLLETIITREDGTQWLGYVRLRGIAIKK